MPAGWLSEVEESGTWGGQCEPLQDPVEGHLAQTALELPDEKVAGERLLEEASACQKLVDSLPLRVTSPAS